MVDLNREVEPSVEAGEIIKDMFLYHPWDQDQIRRGEQVRDSLMNAVRIIISCVPPSPDRTVAIRKLREARMDCNSAITHGGKY